MSRGNSTINQKDWNKFAKGHAKANETRTSAQVVADVERQKNARKN